MSLVIMSLCIIFLEDNCVREIFCSVLNHIGIYAEIIKMIVMDTFVSITRSDPRSFPMKYAEALRNEGKVA